MAELNLAKLRVEVRKLIELYITRLIEIYNKDILSINLYGSAVGNDFSPKNSDINVLFIFKKLTFQDLKKDLNVISQGISKKIAVPLFLTLEEITTSLDIFPVEFLEIKENYLCLYGDDILATLELSNKNLKLFCKEQIKGKVIRLRQAYMEVGLRKKGVEMLMKESLYSLIPIFRNLLRLKKISPPVSKENVLVKFSEKFKLDVEPFMRILKDKRDDEKINEENVDVYFEKYFNQIEKIADIAGNL